MHGIPKETGNDESTSLCQSMFGCVRSYVLHIKIRLYLQRDSGWKKQGWEVGGEWCGWGTECMALREGCLPFILVTLAHLVATRRRKTKKKRNERQKRKRDRGKGIKAARNPPAISIHPIGRRMDARCEGLRGLGAARKKDRGCGKRSLSCPRMVHRSTMRHIDFIFIPNRHPARPLSRRPLHVRSPASVRKEVPSSLKERFSTTRRGPPVSFP